jgi:tetratricopeptide (TPR) repeat protein
MRRSLHVAKRISLVLLIGQGLLLPVSVPHLFPSTSHAGSTDLNRIGSIGAMQSWLDNLHGEALKAKKENRFTFDLQEQTLKKAGESISKILELEKRGRLSDPKVSKAFRLAFEKNDEILGVILQSNEEVIDKLQEEKLDKVEDTQAFLESPEWQMPHRLISLSRYWMSWGGYYRSFLYPPDSVQTKKLLDEAVAGFTLTLFDIAEQTIVAKSLFGRALCFKELENDAGALKDLEAITKHVRQNDPLYIWSLYEQARLRYKAGDHKAALGHLEELESGIEAKTLTDVLGSEHKRLREKAALEPRAKALLEKIDKETDKSGQGARTLCHEALGVLKRLSRYDADYATELYRLVEENPVFFSDLSYEELGGIGTLAMADDRFKKGEFTEAARRYRRLWTSSDIYIRNRMDDVLFRSGYAYCRTGRWKEALASFDQLYAKFPRSGLVGKAVCLEYVAAAGNYKQASSRTNYARYLESSKKYLKKCPNPRDKDGAHFFIGMDYEKRKKSLEARKEFSAVEEGSPQYWPARYYILKSDVEDLERRKEAGKNGGADTRRRYGAMVSQFDRFHRLPKVEKEKPEIAQILPHMTILQARLFRCGPGQSCTEVVRALEGFEERFPKNRSLWLTAANLRLECFRDGQMIESAKEEIESILKGVPLDRDLWDFLAEWGEAYDEEAGRWDKPGNPDRGAAWRDLSLTVYTGMADIASKHAGYEEYLDIIQFRMAEILRARGETEKAGRLYRAILTRTPGAADALLNLGKIYEDQGNWDQALEMWRIYSKGIEAGSDVWVDVRYRIAKAHSKMGRGSEACEVITMIRVLHPDAGDEALRGRILDLEKVVCGNAAQGVAR